MSEPKKMSTRVLIVEDEIFIAMALESLLEDLGHHPIGIAADSRQAMALADQAELAFVDINLRDGPTGIEIGRRLVARGVGVVFTTANPDMLGDGVPGAIGVISKPASNAELRQVIDYALALREPADAAASPPQRLKLFDEPGLGPSYV
jgi:CheY-like chemotaxis protein